MTKVDKENYEKGKQLPVIFNDAHASLRGFAESNLNSSVVLSAGMNPRLYSYFEQFPVFYPDANGHLQDRKSTRLNSSHVRISYAVFCLKKKIHISRPH